MLDLFNNKQDDFLPDVQEDQLNDEQVIEEIWNLKKKLADQLVILGHHYQQDDVIQFADITGDSLKLAREASKLDKKYIMFCGVHFMAETADMLSTDEQVVVLPDLNAGCSMADMANREQIDKAWEWLNSHTEDKIVPVTYINCDAQLKAFVGENDGSICTSSNAEKVIEWALSQGQKLMFFPDQHLGRNTCFKMGIPLEDMVVYNPNMQYGGLTPEQVKNAKVILWYGYCSVHQGFTTEHITALRKDSPETKIIVHPECSFDVWKNADDAGSTSYIIDAIAKAPSGAKIAVGTEINLVNRLNAQYPDKNITSLSPYQCLCTTMYRVRPRWLLASLRAIDRSHPINVIKVPKEIANQGLKALDRMLDIS